MAKDKAASDLIKDLEEKGGEHAPWYEVEGARIGSVLRAALEQGVEITETGGLRMKKASPYPTHSNKEQDE